MIRSLLYHRAYAKTKGYPVFDYISVDEDGVTEAIMVVTNYNQCAIICDNDYRMFTGHTAKEDAIRVLEAGGFVPVSEVGV